MMPRDAIETIVENLRGIFDLLLDDSMTLPQHEGPLILILGGSAMLAVSLFASLFLQNRRWAGPTPDGTGTRTVYPHHARRLQTTTANLGAHTPGQARPTSASSTRTAHTSPTSPTSHTPQVFHTVPTPHIGRTPRVRRRWIRVLRRASRQAGLGRPRHLVAPGGRHAIQLKHCRSCRAPHHEQDGCRWEQIVLENALREHAPHARVVEVSCDPRHGRCRFEVVPGGPS